jgi:type IV pilus assembly protein PilN
MIKINLVPVKEKKKRKELFIVFWVAILFIIIALGMTWIYVQRKAVETDLINQIAQVKEEAKKYEEKIREIKEVEENERKLEDFKKMVKGITETQRKVVAAIDQLALALPDGVWFKEITQGKENDSNKFTIKGYAFSQVNLGNLMTKLQRNVGIFKEITLKIKSILTSVGSNRQIHEFEITVKVVEQ